MKLSILMNIRTPLILITTTTHTQATLTRIPIDIMTTETIMMVAILMRLCMQLKGKTVKDLMSQLVLLSLIANQVLNVCIMATKSISLVQNMYVLIQIATVVDLNLKNLKNLLYFQTGSLMLTSTVTESQMFLKDLLKTPVNKQEVTKMKMVMKTQMLLLTHTQMVMVTDTTKMMKTKINPQQGQLKLSTNLLMEAVRQKQQLQPLLRMAPKQVL